MKTTFTVLVTVEHNDDMHIYTGKLSEMIRQGLEEGTREHKPVTAALVNTWPGCAFAKSTPNIASIQQMHKSA